MKYLLSLVLLTISCTQCNPQQNATYPEVKDTEYCKAAELNLQQLHCVEGNPTKKGKSFNDLCVELQSNPTPIFVNPKCLSQIKSCDEVKSCNQFRE